MSGEDEVEEELANLDANISLVVSMLEDVTLELQSASDKIETIRGMIERDREVKE